MNIQANPFRQAFPRQYNFFDSLTEDECLVASMKFFEDSYTILRQPLHRATDEKLRLMFDGGSKKSAVLEILKFLSGQSEHCLTSSFFIFNEEFLINKNSSKISMK